MKTYMQVAYSAVLTNGDAKYMLVNRLVNMLEWESTVDMMTACKLDMSDAADQHHRPTELYALAPGAYLDVQIGLTPQLLQPMGRAIITRHEIHYPSDQPPHVNLHGLDGATILHAAGDGQNGKKWVNQTHSQIVTAIASKHQFIADVQSTSASDTLLQKASVSDFVFIRNLANVNNFEWWIDYNYQLNKWALHWKEPSSKNVATLTYGVSQPTLLDASIRYALGDKYSGIKLLIYSHDTGKWVQFAKGATGARASAHQPFKKLADVTGVPWKYRVEVAGKAIDVIVPNIEPNDAALYIKKWFAANIQNFVVLTGIALPPVLLQARQYITIHGLGRYDGVYYLQTVRHVINSSGYRTHFVANKVVS